MFQITTRQKEGFILVLVPVLFLLISGAVYEGSKIIKELNSSVNTFDTIIADQRKQIITDTNRMKAVEQENIILKENSTDTANNVLSSTNTLNSTNNSSASTSTTSALDLVSATSSGNASASDILNNKVAWVNGVEVKGTMINNGSFTLTASATDQAVTAGYYSGGTLTGDADLISTNILSGKTIFGISGNSNVVNTSSGTATANDLLNGLVAWVDGSEVTGTMATQTLSALNDTVSAGYYAATTLSAIDTDLVTGNILAGKTIFGISGNSNVVNTSTGTATASDLLDGLVAWVDGSEITGTMPTNTLTAANDTVSAGYYSATTLSAVDTDLATGNILSGTTIFGVSGNSNVVNTSSGTATSGDLLSGLVAWVDGLEVTGTMPTNTLTAANDTVSAGYYAATTLSAIDTDLIAGNIISGVTIFGIAGNAVVGYTYGDEDQSLVLTTATSAGTYNATNLSVGTVKSGTSFGVGLTGDYPSATYPLAGAGTVAGAADVATGKVAWSNDGTQITGSGTVTDLTPAGACATQAWYDGSGSANETDNCSLTWTANPDATVTGDDALTGRGGYDIRTGLTWSNYLKNNAGTVEFATSSGSTWNWNGQLRFTVVAADATAGATYTNNSQTFTVVTTIAGGTTLTTTPTGSPEASGTLTKTAGTGDDTIVFSSTNSKDTNSTAVGGKTASQLCSDRGNGWRLPTQKELMLAYIDGAYWNLTQPSNGYWSATESSSTSAYYVNLYNGSTGSYGKTSANNVRCVR